MPPTTGILDDFNRADQTGLGASWSANAFTNYPSFNIASNAASNAAAAFRSNYWSSAFDADQEFYCTLGAAANAFYLLARLVNPGAAPTAYQVLFEATGGVAHIQKMVAGTTTQLGANVSLTAAAGDGILLRVEGSTISLHHKPSGGSWSEVATRTDTAITAGGFAGFLLNNNTTTFTLDDAGGGSLPQPVRPGTSNRRLMSRRRTRRRRSYA
ncbi:MAG TPA: hypothetical protein VNA28_13425 [Solirubrobacteraceae bacterium]|nr:hypothetical protein [Solirubrobacteraceae bacterium]